MSAAKRKPGIEFSEINFTDQIPQKCDLTHHIIYVVLNLNLSGIGSESGAGKNRNSWFSLVGTHINSECK